jgi:hypothetical protein
MGTWNVDVLTEPGILRLTLSGAMTAEDMEVFVDAHNRAVDGYNGREYRVWVDIRDLQPLHPDVADTMERTKAYSNRHANFRGSAVLVASATVAMQHRRTSVTGGVMGSELISEDPVALRAHLRTVDRRSRTEIP